MQQTLLTILLLCVLPTASFAQRGFLLGLPYDDPNARDEVYSRIELKPLITEYDQIVIIRLGKLKGEEIQKVFGPMLERRGLLDSPEYPTNSVAPLFASHHLFSGLLIEDKSHRDLYAIGDIGYVQFCYELDGRFAIAVLYTRLDDKFVPLKSAANFQKRFEWDKAKFEEIKKWLSAHLVPIENAEVFFQNATNTITK